MCWELGMQLCRNIPLDFVLHSCHRYSAVFSIPCEFLWSLYTGSPSCYTLQEHCPSGYQGMSFCFSIPTKFLPMEYGSKMIGMHNYRACRFSHPYGLVKEVSSPPFLTCISSCTWHNAKNSSELAEPHECDSWLQWYFILFLYIIQQSSDRDWSLFTNRDVAIVIGVTGSKATLLSGHNCCRYFMRQAMAIAV